MAFRASLRAPPTTSACHLLRSTDKDQRAAFNALGRCRLRARTASSYIAGSCSSRCSWKGMAPAAAGLAAAAVLLLAVCHEAHAAAGLKIGRHKVSGSCCWGRAVCLCEADGVDIVYTRLHCLAHHARPGSSHTPSARHRGLSCQHLAACKNTALAMLPRGTAEHHRQQRAASQAAPVAW